MTTVNPSPCTLAQSAGRVASMSYDANKIAQETLAHAEDKHALNAFAALPEEEIFEQAVAANALRATNKHTPLTGAPIAISDTLVTAWGHTEAGSDMLRGYRSPFNAAVVDRLLEAGALIFGKTNVSEMGVGVSTQASRHGITRNPAYLSHLVGGSASGAAAAVGASIVPIALGVDTHGGARIAAAHTGVLCLRPTYGAISRYGAIAYASSMDCVSILGHCVEDLAHVFDHIAGHDPRDGTSVRSPAPSVAPALEGEPAPFRVGIIKELMDLPMDDAQRQAVERTKNLLIEQGCTVVDVSVPTAHRFAPIASVISSAEASTNFARYDGVRFGHRTQDASTIETLYERTRAEGFGPDVLHTILLGTQMMYRDHYATHFQRAQRVRHRVALDYKRVFGQVDVILGPGAAATAALADCQPPTPKAAAETMRFTAGEALAGLPAVTLPAGRCPQGLPVGVQLTAHAHNEALLLRAAHAVQQWQPSFGEKTP